MAFYHRRFLLSDEPKVHDEKHENDKKHEPHCFDCYKHSSPPPPPPPSKTHHFSTFLILTVCFFGAVFLYLAYYAIHRCWSKRNITNSAQPMENENITENDFFIDELQGRPVVDHPIWYIRTIGLPEAVIDSITAFKYKKRDGLIEKSDCSVCLNEFQEDESLRLLPKCSHAFHMPCIDTWLRSHKNCPVCRAPVVTGGGNNHEGFDEVDLVGAVSSGSGPGEEINRVGSEIGLTEGSGNFSGSDVEDDKLAEILSTGRGDCSARNGKFRVLSDLGDHGRVRVINQEFVRKGRRAVSMDFSLFR